MLVNLRTALARAPVCFGFNVTSLEILDALVSVGEASPAATILQMTDRYIDHFGEPLIRQWIRPRLAASPQAFVLHLDHGVSIGTIDRALRLGFTSVMYDGSRLALADNIAQTRLAAEKARHVNASLEAEVGHVGGQEDGAAAEDSWLTTVEEARAFAAGVQVDALAISVGTAHGGRPGNLSPNLRVDRIRDIAAAVRVPLVLHGGSGVSPALLQRAIEAGIRKVNIGTELKRAWAESFPAALRETREPWQVRDLVVVRLMAVIRHFGRITRTGEESQPP